jgi:hypothetical protein
MRTTRRKNSAAPGRPDRSDGPIAAVVARLAAALDAVVAYPYRMVLETLSLMSSGSNRQGLSARGWRKLVMNFSALDGPV